MKLQTSKSRLRGTVAIPASKSHTIRAVAIASLAEGQSIIRNPLISDDALSAINSYGLLGAKMDCSDKKNWKITGMAGNIKAPEKIIDVGNSGTTLRLAVASAALVPKGQKITFTGDAQIQTRPLQPLLDSLNDLGAKVRSLKNNGSAPLEIEGQLIGGKTTIECFTSQYLSSLLLATPLAQKDTEIIVPLLNEPDYAKMTLDWLGWQGIKYENQDMKRFIIKGAQKYKAFDRQIPADFSSATFFLCAGVILDADITITGLDFSDSQPDKAVVDYLKRMGAKIEITPAGVHIKSSPLKGVDIDMNRTPDALPAMATAAAFAQGTTRFLNVPQARKKETDRIKCMAEELAKLGAKTEELPDGLIVEGGKLKSANLDGRGDHRIVMALAIAAMAMDEPCTIDTAEAMNVTFPDFVKLMKQLGADINLSA
ncbi:MAG: 3-phosphoshikimate 1-carboxyvinyltransferase [Planctomycetes bacterium]|nr:3-phosphoshikimate 1-carboxyvinyltransferase [Planctomycetota bacterium]MBU1518618.1 3-phosphoshikimate 1-carboxyvinyltransferase [Planctomycetota bacterium]MBU2458552.1 3-phosphoshikimate 1-carboxyvinyltransferase [Planctomycetota bacterium]